MLDILCLIGYSTGEAFLTGGRYENKERALFTQKRTEGACTRFVQPVGAVPCLIRGAGLYFIKYPLSV